MSALLSIDFQKHYRSGTVVQAAFSQPIEGFHSTVLFGPSGSGKTTVLRCVAGLERPETGTIQFGNQTWFDSVRAIHRRPQARGIGFLFQDYALFPHLTIEQNILYGLNEPDRRQRRFRAIELLKSMDLLGLERRYPHQISAGQQQRVALARAVAPRPKLLLLDEPLSSLDAPTRQSLRHELRTILSELKTPALIVTHDPLEAVALADHAVVLSEGQVRQRGPIDEVFSRPADPTVARIVGVETIQPGFVVAVNNGLATVQAGSAELTAISADITSGPVHVCIRGEEVTLERGRIPQTSARNQLAARVVSLYPEGATVRVVVDCGFILTALVTRPAVEQLALAVGDPIIALIKAPAIHLLRR